MNQSDCPSHMMNHYVEKHFKLSDDKKNNVWNKLQRRETFTKGQIPPYRVEFNSSSQEGNFESGELNIHHGPLLSVHGVIGDITDSYRDLKYFYGSYVISFRFIRPVRLEFFKDDEGIKLKIHSYIHPWIKPFWEFGNNIFWRFFGISFLF